MESGEILTTTWMWLFLSAPFCHATAPETFSVQVPDGSVSAKLGSSVVFPCSLSPSFSAVELEVRWYRPNKFSTPVLLYKDQKIQENPVDPQCSDRVSLIGRLEEGNVSLKLENITLSDRGDYECHISSGVWYDKGTTSLTVNVLGSEPVLSVTETGEQVNVTCVSDGWSTQPTVTWRDREGREIKHNSHVMYKKDSDDLVRVSSWLLFSPSESEWISCSVSLSDQEEREGRAMPVRTKMSTASKTPWRAFVVMLVISLLSLSVVCILLFILYKRTHHQKSAAAPREPVGTDAAGTSDEAIPLHGKDEAESAAREPETANKETNRDTFEIPGWDKMCIFKEPLTLDASASHKYLTVKSNRKELTYVSRIWHSEIESHNVMFDVLCKEKFKSDCHYWEVIVLDAQKAVPLNLSWYVGVTSHEEKERKKKPLTPENGYWVLQYERGKGFYVNPGDPILVLVRDLFSTLGVYLNMTKSTLSFFDADAKSHLYTFTNVKSENVLIPLFSPAKKCEHSLKLK